ncbi:MAG: hypothetical protein HW390_113 [Candidatus Brocadiaceae bacterium]|nr:hypothetical protein [Candidatus Brocadiaceae bacterium]
MKKESLSLLLGYLTNQMELLRRILKEIDDTNPSSKEKTSPEGATERDSQHGWYAYFF